MQPLPTTLRSGNLSVLKKRWEQQEPTSCKAQPQATICTSTKPQTCISHPAGPKPKPSPQIETQPDTLTALSQDQDIQTSGQSQSEHHTQTSKSHSGQTQSVRSCRSLEDLADMEFRRDSERLEGAAAEVPESERPSVPLNSLKMMFEKGENLTDKASLLFSVIIRLMYFHENWFSLMFRIKRLMRCKSTVFSSSSNRKGS